VRYRRKKFAILSPDAFLCVLLSQNETQCPMINHGYVSAPLKYISSKSWWMAWSSAVYYLSGSVVSSWLASSVNVRFLQLFTALRRVVVVRGTGSALAPTRPQPANRLRIRWVCLSAGGWWFNVAQNCYAYGSGEDWRVPDMSRMLLFSWTSTRFVRASPMSTGRIRNGMSHEHGP